MCLKNEVKALHILRVESKKDKRSFIDFIYSIYNNNTSFKDTLISIVKTFLNKGDTFTKECEIIPICVIDDEKILAQCILIYHHLLPMLQIGFFDAKQGQDEAVDLLINEAKGVAKSLNLEKIIVGLNGHVSYGVGILMDKFDSHIPFDSLYNKEYYVSYFDKRGFFKRTLTTFKYKTKQIEFPPRLIKKLDEQFSYRYLDIKDYKNEMTLFGDLCNETLKETPYYFSRKPICMYELVKDLKPFLKPENLIFALKDGKEIGFIFWHPDYNEILPGGKKNSMLSIGLRFLFRRKYIKKMIINAIGITKPYQRSFIAYGLLNEVYKVCKDDFEEGVTNFVFDDNPDSILFNKNNTEEEDRHYCVYEIKV